LTSIALDYDAEDDWLEVSFGRQDDLSQTYQLNDNITIEINSAMSRITRMTFVEYARLLMVNETEFTALHDEMPYTVAEILRLLQRPPANQLLLVVDPDALIARVLSPTLQDLFES